MTYPEAKAAALNCTTWAAVDQLLKQIEDTETITNRQYYDLKHIAIDAAYRHQTAKEA